MDEFVEMLRASAQDPTIKYDGDSPDASYRQGHSDGYLAAQKFWIGRLETLEPPTDKCVVCLNSNIAGIGVWAAHYGLDTTPVHTGECYRKYQLDQLLCSLVQHRKGAFSEIELERKRQNKEWGDGPLKPGYELAILMEEVGEVARAHLESAAENLPVELIQVAAVCVRWFEAIK